MKSSLSALLCVLSLLSIADSASFARANSRPYCIAYARDLADRKVTLPPSAEATMVNPAGDTIAATASISQPSGEERKMERLWRRAYKSALQGCLDQYPEEQPKSILVAPKAAAPAKPVAEVAKPAKQANLSTVGPKRGSEEWRKKCLAAHPSFDATTGTYRTYSGAQRECR